MAANTFGYQFQPGSGDIRGGGAPTPTQTPMSPVQTLNFNLPTREAQGAIAPQSLLQAQGASGSGLPNTQLLQMLLKIFQPQGQGASASGASLPGMDAGRADNGPQDYASQQPSANASQASWGGLGSVFGTPRIVAGGGGDVGPAPQVTATPGAAPGTKMDAPNQTQPSGPSPAPLFGDNANQGGAANPVGNGFRDWLSGENAMNGRGSPTPLF